MEQPMHMITERVWCCVCSGTGQLRQFLFWKRACHICDGTGQRRIIMDERFPEDVKRRLRDDAMFGINTYAALSGRRNNSISSILPGFF